MTDAELQPVMELNPATRPFLSYSPVSFIISHFLPLTVTSNKRPQPLAHEI